MRTEAEHHGAAASLRGWAMALADGLADLIGAHSCAGCGAESVLICPACAEHLTGEPRQVWPRPAPSGMPPPYAVTEYTEPVRGMLRAHKEDGIRPLAGPLGAAAARAALALLAERGVPLRRVLIVPVPSSGRALRRRGHDAVGRMARAAAASLRRAGQPALFLPALVHQRRVEDQSGLGAAARARNLAGAFRVRGGQREALERREVVVLDDVVTTGATLAEAARALRAVGARVVGAATVAAVARGPTSPGRVRRGPGEAVIPPQSVQRDPRVRAK